MSGFPVSYRGCIRRLRYNSRKILLIKDDIITARNVADCDGTACGGDVCSNGGTCALDTAFNPQCTCTKVSIIDIVIEYKLIKIRNTNFLVICKVAEFHCVVFMKNFGVF